MQKYFSKVVYMYLQNERNTYPYASQPFCFLECSLTLLLVYYPVSSCFFLTNEETDGHGQTDRSKTKKVQ